jgi:hypothetical protein
MNTTTGTDIKEAQFHSASDASSFKVNDKSTNFIPNDEEQQNSKQQKVIESVLKYAFGYSVPENFWDEGEEIDFPSV